MRPAALIAMLGLILSLTALAPAWAPVRLAYDWSLVAADANLSSGVRHGISSSAALIAADIPLPLPYDVASLLADNKALSGGEGDLLAALSGRERSAP